MKKNKFLKLFFVFCFMCLFISGCGNKKEEKLENNENNTTAAPQVSEKEKLGEKSDQISTEAKNDLESSQTIQKDKIKESIDYIEKNIDDAFKNNDVSEKMLYHASYLIHASNKNESAITHNIGLLGNSVETYTRNIYTKSQKIDNEVSTSLKSDIDKKLNEIKNNKDNLINEFVELVNKK